MQRCPALSALLAFIWHSLGLNSPGYNLVCASCLFPLQHSETDAKIRQAPGLSYQNLEVLEPLLKTFCD
jgi:hypothetical protein